VLDMGKVRLEADIAVRVVAVEVQAEVRGSGQGPPHVLVSSGK
jgi:hypothetical protein